MKPGVISLLITALAATTSRASSMQVSTEPKQEQGVFECVARPGHFDAERYDLNGVTHINATANLLWAAPTKAWAAAATFDLMRSNDDEAFMRLLFQSERPPSRLVHVVVIEAGAQESIKVGEFKRVERIPFSIIIDDTGATLVGIGKSKANVRITSFRPAIGRALCTSSTAVFDGLTFPVLKGD